MKPDPRFLLPLLCLSLPGLAVAQWSSQEEALLYDQSVSGYGSSTDIDGDTAVVGAPQPSTGQSGRAFVYVRNAGVWSEQAELVGSDSGPGDVLGSSVAIHGDTIVVGAPGQDPSGVFGAGSAYVFVRTGTTWTQQAKLIASNAAANDNFGTSVAVFEDTIVVGAPNKYVDWPSRGMVYVFRRNGTTWTQEASFTQELVHHSRFGYSVAVEGDRLFVGAHQWFNGSQQLGAALVFARSGSTWTQTQILEPNVADLSNFGTAVAIQGNRAIVGAPAENNFQGAAYVYKLTGSTWSLQQKIIGQDALPYGWFGEAVAVSEHQVVVGTHGPSDESGVGTGAAKYFTFDGAQWIERLELVGSQSAQNDWLGIAVAIDGDFVIAGAPKASTGETYVWRIDPPVTEIYCSAQINSQGCLPAIGSSGTPSVTSALPFFVTASQIINNKAGILYYSYAPDSAPFFGGLRCVGLPLYRLAPQNSGGTPPPTVDCTGTFSFDFNARIQSGVDFGLVVGEDVYCQWWYRDPMAGKLTGLSDALRFRIQP